MIKWRFFNGICSINLIWNVYPHVLYNEIRLKRSLEQKKYGKNLNCGPKTLILASRTPCAARTVFWVWHACFRATYFDRNRLKTYADKYSYIIIQYMQHFFLDLSQLCYWRTNAEKHNVYKQMRHNIVWEGKVI